MMAAIYVVKVLAGSAPSAKVLASDLSNQSGDHDKC